MATSWQSKSRHVETKTSKFGEAEFITLLESGVGENIMRAFLKILRERFIRRIREMKIGHEGDLEESFSTAFSKGSTSLSGRVNYNYYGRFVDLGVGKGVTLDEVKSGQWYTNNRTASEGHRRVPKPWYSDTIPYEMHRLAELFAEASQEQIVPQIADALSSNIDLKI